VEYTDINLAEKIEKIEKEEDIASLYLGVGIGLMSYNKQGAYYLVDKYLEKAKNLNAGTSSKLAARILDLYRLQKGVALKAESLFSKTLKPKSIASHFGVKSNANYMYDADPNLRDSIKTAADYQKQIIDQRNIGLNAFLSEIKKHAGRLNEVPLYVIKSSDYSFEEGTNENPSESKRDSSKCKVEEVSENILRFNKCGYVSVKSLYLNEADFLDLRIRFGTLAVMLNLESMWDITGTELLVQIRKDMNLTHEEAMQILSLEDAFGKYRTDVQPVNFIRNNLQDIKSSIEYVSKVRDSAVCERPQFSRSEGDYVPIFICYPQLINFLNPILESGLEDKTVNLASEGEEEELVNVGRLLNNPVKDLKEQFPTEFNACGYPAKMKDPTFNGFYPGKDAVKRIFGGDGC
jgi:hypothetical protein